MKSASWAGAVILLLALVAVHLFDHLGDAERPRPSGSMPMPGGFVLEVVAATDGYLGVSELSERAMEIMVRDGGADAASITAFGAQIRSGPMGWTASTSFNGTAPGLDLALIEPGLLSAAIDELNLIDEGIDAVVRIAVVRPDGERIERFIVNDGGRPRWTDSLPRP